MEITEKDYQDLRDFLDKGLEAVLNEAVPVENDHYVFPIGIYLGCSKGMAIGIYMFCKPLLVYFQNANSLWLLNHKGELVSVRKGKSD